MKTVFTCFSLSQEAHVIHLLLSFSKKVTAGRCAIPGRSLKLVLLTAYILLVTVPLGAQSYRLELQGINVPDEKIIQVVKPGQSYANQTEALTFLQQIIPSLQANGYLAASIDSISLGSNLYRCLIYLGQQYKWARVSFASLPPALVVATAVNPAQWEGRPLAPAGIGKLSERILTWCENNGYPFARVWLDSLEIQEDGGVSGHVMLDKGVKRTIDSVVINGEVRISKNYLLRYIDIREGQPYNEQKLRTLSNRLRELPFLQEEKPWSVYFKATDTKLYLNLKERPANQFNAIIGLQPNSQETGKFLLTVDGQAALQNVLGFGESMSLTVQKLQYRSTMIKADVAWPYLFNTPVGAEAHFELYNKDTTFRRTTFQLGGRYQFSATDYLRLFYENRNNGLITIDLPTVLAQKKLPDNIDATANGAGAELILNRTDYRINPRKGWHVRLMANALLRKTKRSDAVLGLTDGSGFNYATLYDSLDQDSYQYRLNGDIACYLPVGKKATFKAAYAGGWISGQKLFMNELYQVGGFKLLRGFDEESIFVNQYHVTTLEFRLLLSPTSNVYLFSDNGWLESRFNGSNSSAVYNGFGVGTSLQTNSGLFTIAYALGRSDLVPLNVRQSKVHFGYVAFF